MDIKIKSALISVFDKEGLDGIIHALHTLGVTLYSTGGTHQYIESLGVPVVAVESLTGYPSIMDGRVKTLHPAVFGGILARRNSSHVTDLEKYNIPEIDLVVVDLYPFEDTLKNTDDQHQIIEKIDIGGISLIRAAAKNFTDVVVVPSKMQYDSLHRLLTEQQGISSLQQRRELAAAAFRVSASYDAAIAAWVAGTDTSDLSAVSVSSMLLKSGETLRYGENPHQRAAFYGNMEASFIKRCGKELSYNNMVDIDAAMQLMREFRNAPPTFAILKHTNACGVATRDTVSAAWDAALQADPVSAFGGILISNTIIDHKTAVSIDDIFYEVLLAPGFTDEAYDLLSSRSKRVLLQIASWDSSAVQVKSILNGFIVQDADISLEDERTFEVKTKKSPDAGEMKDLAFALACAKHLKSNTIVLAKNLRLLGMGCGQTSRVDACAQAIDKAKKMGFSLEGAVMASDAFFPFPDCIELASEAGISAVVQPGGSMKDSLSIDACNERNMSMVFTGVRHFRH
jgi:phosphoribosylaminoimidazolecarboxamide formyltransferase/IMP cyclohydrolase